MILADNMNVTLITGNEVIDGEAYGGTFKWKLDISQKPIHLDFNLKQDSNTEVLPQIVRFVTDTRLQFAGMDDMVSRPTDFSNQPGKTVLVFTKQ